MCWAGKCCFFIKLDFGCLILGILSLIFSALISIASTVLLVLEDSPLPDYNITVNNRQSTPKITNAIKNPNVKDMKDVVFHLEINKDVINVLLALVLLAAVIGILFSIMLIIGILKRKPGLLLYYFFYGVLLTFVSFLTALLEVLQSYWVLSLVQFLFTLLFIHCLVVVHTAYELMARGKLLDDADPPLLEEVDATFADDSLIDIN